MMLISFHTIFKDITVSVYHKSIMSLLNSTENTYSARIVVCLSGDEYHGLSL